MWASSNTFLLSRTEPNWFLLLLLSQVLNEIMNGFQITGWSIFNLHLSSLLTSSDIVDHSLHLEILWHTTLFFFFFLLFYFNSCFLLVYPIASSFSLWPLSSGKSQESILRPLSLSLFFFFLSILTHLAFVCGLGTFNIPNTLVLKFYLQARFLPWISVMYILTG